MNLKRIIAVDPGVTTGLAVHEMYEDGVNPQWKREELGPDKHHKELWDFFLFNPPDVIVCERFEYRNVRNKGVEMPGIRLESREYIGVCELFVQTFVHVKLVMQPTNCKGEKALISPDKLKGLGLYRAPSGRQHMNDATAHALHYIVVTEGRRDYLKGLRPGA